MTVAQLKEPYTVTDLVKELNIEHRAFIQGEYTNSQSGKTFDCVSPINGQVVSQIAETDKADVDIAVKVARDAFNSGVWSMMIPVKRKKILAKFADLILKNKEELTFLEALDIGKPISMAGRIDVPGAAQSIAWYGELVDKFYDEVAPSTGSSLRLITHEPCGVVACVVPWNFPLLMASWKIAPALAAGNSVILKPAEQSPLTAIRIAQLAKEAGIPDGVLNVLPGFGETAGKALGLHDDVDIVAFTGSTQVGKYFLEYAGQSNMKRVSLECGGKSPNIIFADAPHMDKLAQWAAQSIYFNSGQACNAGSRLLIENSIKDEFIEKVMAVGKFMAPNDPLKPDTNFGAIVDKTQLDRVLNYINIGKEEGARVRAGGERILEETGGYFIAPTLFDQVNNNMRIAQEEIFGPVLVTMGFDTEEEALAIANDSQYGLEAAVWTNNIQRAHRLARSVRAGTVRVNTMDGGDITTPFGGYKQSGIGRDKSIHALTKYMEVKSTIIGTV